VGLEGEVPVRVTEDIVDDLGGVLTGTGLEIEMGGRDLRCPMLHVLGWGAGRCGGGLGKIDDFQFIGTGKDDAGALFG